MDEPPSKLYRDLCGSISKISTSVVSHLGLLSYEAIPGTLHEVIKIPYKSTLLLRNLWF